MQGEFKVGEWLVQPQLNLLNLGDRAVSIEPKVMDVLVCLAEKAGEVLSKKRLIAAVWPDAFVGDEVLTYSISELRKALGDDARNPSFIQTIPRRGYRLIAPVEMPQPECRFKIVKRLGQGAMGEVYLAEDNLLRRKVALKFPLLDSEQREKEEKLILREARAAAALDHPFVCKVYDTGELDGRFYLSMEYVPGQTLQERLSLGPMALAECLRIAAGIAEALEFAHQHGVVHRDVKPSNIILSEQGHVKVTDFGVAGRVAPHGERQDWTATLTEEFSSIGTIPYMSPEQVNGSRPDARSDIFSFGVLLYEMLSGQNPFRKDTPIETAAAILHLTPPPLSIDPSGPGQSISGALDRMLAKKPSARCHSMSEVRALLREVDRRPDQFAPPRTSLQPESQAAGGKAALWRSRKLLPIRLLGLLVGLIAATAIWALWWFALRETPATARLPARTFPLTSDGQWKCAPALSPDGKLVAFSWNGPSATNFDLYVKPTDPDTAILRLTSDPAFDSEGSWSPDGKRLAFIRLNGARATIYTIPSLGGQEKKIIDVEGLVPNVLEPDNDAPAWSPAGNWLAYAAKPSQEEPFQILLVDPQTREKRVLTTPPAGSRGDLNPSFSPDGRQVAFVRGSGNQHSGLDIWIQDLGGQPPRQLTSQGYELCYGLSWMPGGKELLFTAGFLSGQRVYRMDLAEGVPRPLTGLGEGSWFASVSGQKMAYLRVSGSPPNVWRVPGRLATDRTAPPQELIRSSYLDMNSAFSFDGKRIAFQSQRSGRPQIWVSDANGADPIQLTDVKTQAGTPRWSPDGSKITFDSFDSGNSDIYVVQVDDGSVVRMTAHPAKDSQGTFSRDGLSIYFASNRSGTDQVWKMPARGGEAAQVTRQGGSYALESWDGKHLYYVHESESENLPWTSISIRRVPVGGGEEADVLRVADWTAWDLAPTGIYYSSRHWTPMEAGTAGPRFGESYKILYLNLEDGETTEIFREKGQFQHWWLAVSPDEKSILYSRKPVSESDLVLVENFR